MRIVADILEACGYVIVVTFLFAIAFQPVLFPKDHPRD